MSEEKMKKNGADAQIRETPLSKLLDRLQVQNSRKRKREK